MSLSSSTKAFVELSELFAELFRQSSSSTSSPLPHVTKETYDAIHSRFLLLSDMDQRNAFNALYWRMLQFYFPAFSSESTYARAIEPVLQECDRRQQPVSETRAAFIREVEHHMDQALREWGTTTNIEIYDALRVKSLQMALKKMRKDAYEHFQGSGDNNNNDNAKAMQSQKVFGHLKEAADVLEESNWYAITLATRDALFASPEAFVAEYLAVSSSGASASSGSNGIGIQRGRVAAVSRA